MLFVDFHFVYGHILSGISRRTTPSASHYLWYRHTATSSPISLLKKSSVSIGRRPVVTASRRIGDWLSLLIYFIFQLSVAATVHDDFTRQAGFANAAPFGLGPREERLD
jgi:hypothetical protein